MCILTLGVQSYPNPLASSARLIYWRIIIGWSACMVTRNARLKDFITDGYPSSGLPVQALAEDHVGTYILPFSCERINGEWRNRATGRQFRRTSLGGERCRQKAETARAPLSSRPKHETDDLTSSRQRGSRFCSIFNSDDYRLAEGRFCAEGRGGLLSP
jgi:hypothetical protein